ncbi:sugar ABC transporter permease [Paenibacillus antri]|uniref:Sugar ABC transporter permease n=2 Tax=Paenibacillus antri TaxID=2582848 RepID=A0A5R9GIJ4_9BACL|nr:sugar ABC transporter permease [Paenibacillus antri]
MGGIAIAFQNYSPIRGMMGSDWVGFAHFARLFGEPDFWMIFRNTLVLSMLGIIFLFPAPILLALVLNEVRSKVYKRTVQTIIYLPHFISWVVIVSLTFVFLSTEVGLLNKLLVALGFDKVRFMMEEDYFYPIVLLQGLWKDVGWNTIIYLAAIAGVNPSLYEAAEIDGAGRFSKVWNVTVPSIVPTVIILFILGLGNILEVNFEQLWLMQNPLVLNVSEVFDTYVYKVGIQGGQFSYSTAVGIFKSFVGLALIVGANYWIRKKGYEGIW